MKRLLYLFFFLPLFALAQTYPTTIIKSWQVGGAPGSGYHMISDGAGRGIWSRLPYVDSTQVIRNQYAALQASSSLWVSKGRFEDSVVTQRIRMRSSTVASFIMQTPSNATLLSLSGVTAGGFASLSLFNTADAKKGIQLNSSDGSVSAERFRVNSLTAVDPLTGLAAYSEIQHPYASSSLLSLPAGANGKTLAISVNGQFADSAGNILVSPGGGSQVNSDWNATSGVAQILNKPSIASGTYTPTVSGAGTTATAYPCHYTRIGSEVTVTGVVGSNITGGFGTTAISFSLPAASANFSSPEQALGLANVTAGSAAGTGQVTAVTGTQLATVNWTSTSTGAANVFFTFTYTIQ